MRNYDIEERSACTPNLPLQDTMVQRTHFEIEQKKDQETFILQGPTATYI